MLVNECFDSIHVVNVFLLKLFENLLNSSFILRKKKLVQIICYPGILSIMPGIILGIMPGSMPIGIIIIMPEQIHKLGHYAHAGMFCFLNFVFLLFKLILNL